jgi:peptidoglycan hydrolase CwlO-like protein
MIRAAKRELPELLSDLAHYESQLKRAQAELRRQHQRLLEHTRELEQKSEALREETIRGDAVEAALHRRAQQLAKADTDELNARRRQVHARGRAAIAELGPTGSD